MEGLGESILLLRRGEDNSWTQYVHSDEANLQVPHQDGTQQFLFFVFATAFGINFRIAIKIYAGGVLVAENW